jgi:hypothetical protein
VVARVEAAVEYAKRGWAVLPLWGPRPGSPTGCACGRPSCDSPAKHPITAHGVKDASGDTGVIQEWFRRYPEANIGIATGRISGFDVLDVDGEDGFQTLSADELPHTPSSITGSGGRHVLFEHRPGLRNAVRFAPGLDVRTDNGYIVAPPSQHVSGRAYAWDLEHHPDDVHPAPWPEALYRRVVQFRAPLPPAVEGGQIPDGQRDHALARFAGSMRRTGMTRDEILAALMTINERCAPPKERHELERIATSIARYPSADPVVISAAREGVLSADPADAKPAPWRNVADLKAEAERNPREWLLPKVLYFGSVVFLIGDPKVPGKTTFTLAVASRALQGYDLFGAPLAAPTGVVLLTEEADLDLAKKVGELGIRDDANLSILTRSMMTPRPSWEEAVRLAVERCDAVGARILIIDTFYRWAAFGGEEANRSSSVLAALEHLDAARRKGLLVLLPHHASKGSKEAGREGGLAGLGSVSGAGEAEVNIAIQNPRDRAHPTRRVLHVESRASGLFDLMVELRRGDPALGTVDYYEPIGDAEEINQRDVDSRLVAWVLANPGRPADAIIEGAEVRNLLGHKALPRLSAEPHGRLKRTGKGKAGSPFLYWPRDYETPD